MIYLNEKFYTEIENEKTCNSQKWNLSRNKTYLKIKKTQYELVNNVKVLKNKIIIQSDNNILTLTDNIYIE